jgi:hypothetical protein
MVVSIRTKLVNGSVLLDDIGTQHTHTGFTVEESSEWR